MRAGVLAAAVVAALLAVGAASAKPYINVPCSGQAALVAAINTANSAGGGTINLARGCKYELTSADNGENGLPVITTAVKVNGRDATIDGTGSVRVFEVDGPGGSLFATPACTVIPAGLFTTASSASSKTMSSGIFPAIARRGGCTADPRTAICSPPRRRKDARDTESSTRTSSCAMSCCTPGSASLRHMRRQKLVKPFAGVSLLRKSKVEACVARAPSPALVPEGYDGFC